MKKPSKKKGSKRLNIDLDEDSSSKFPNFDQVRENEYDALAAPAQHTRDRIQTATWTQAA